MKDYLAAIIKRIREGAFYLGLSYQCPVDSAVEVEAIADADDKERARDEFFAAYGLTSQVWANVPKRFPNYQSLTASGVRALAYLCQLRSAKESQDLFINEFHDLINDPNVHNLARIRVNEIKEIKRAARKPRAKRDDKEDWRYRELLDTMKQIEIMAAEHKPYDLIYSEACRSLNTIGDSTPTERHDDGLAERIAQHEAKIGTRPSIGESYGLYQFHRDVLDEPEVAAALASKAGTK